LSLPRRAGKYLPLVPVMRSLVLRADTPLDDGVKGMIAGQLDVAAVRLARSTRRFGGRRGGEVARTAITRLGFPP